jgi:hypothetical protein
LVILRLDDEKGNFPASGVSPAVLDLRPFFSWANRRIFPGLAGDSGSPKQPEFSLFYLKLAEIGGDVKKEEAANYPEDS